MKKKMAIFIIVIAAIVFGILATNSYRNSPTIPNITNFEECVAVGNPVMESYPRQCRDSVSGITFVEEINNLDEYFREEIWEKGIENLGAIPIEGFTPDLYLGAFPGLMKSDFDGVFAINGHWELNQNTEELEFIMVSDQLITSADGTVDETGLSQLLDRLEERLNIEVSTKTDVDEIFDLIEAKEEIASQEENPLIINGKTLQQRLDEATNNLHKEGSTDKARTDFPDLELVFTDNDERYPSDILPFEYFYSNEANKTFNFCAIERTVFICNGKLVERITDEQLNNVEKCTVTPIYSDYTN